MNAAPMLYVSLREAAELELQGAKHRLDLAERACKDFLAEHAEHVLRIFSLTERMREGILVIVRFSF
jgi:hypothetical protein